MGGIAKTVKNIFTGDNPGDEAYQAQMNALIDRMDREWTLPEYDQTPLTPEEYSALTQYAPQIAAFVEQKAPHLLSKVNTEAVQAQNQSLQQLGQLSRSGMDEGMRAQLEEAGMSADQALRSNRANALAALNSRGLGSSGATLSADIQAGLGASEQQRMAALEAANQAAQRKVNAIQGLGSLGSQIAGQEQQMGEFNANTENQYDALIANRRQQYNDYVANAQNQANLYNQQQNQQVANMNTGLKNQYGMYNQQRKDTIMNNMTNAKNQKLQTIAGLRSGQAQHSLDAYNAQQAGNTQMLMAAIAGGVALAGKPPTPPAGGGMEFSGSQTFSPSAYGSYGNMNPNYSLFPGGY